MSLSEISIKNPVFAWMLMIGLMVFGYFSVKDMGISQLPDVDFPMVNISANLEGAAPEVMELDVVDQIESAVMSVEGIQSISSSIKMGSANISVEFTLDKNIDVAVNEIQTKLNQAMRQLPKGMEFPIITKSNPEDRPIMWIAISSEKMSTKDLMAYVRDHLKDKFQTVEGVADVFLGGYVDPNLRIWLSNDMLTKNQLSTSDIINTIKAEHSEIPSGYIENDKIENNVRVIGEAKSVEEILKLPILRRGGAPNFNPISLDKVATVEDGLADVRRISRVMGKPSVGIGIRKQRGSNSVAVGDGVKARLEKIKKELPESMSIGINFDNTVFIKDSIHEISFTLILSSILTAIVCWLFLGSFSSTINVVMAIPTSILGSFILLKFFGFTLNTFTLLALSLSIGIVVDDAIMVLENIFRHHELGLKRREASLTGSKEISLAALAATISIMAIFLPVAFMDGIIGKYFYQFGITISVAVAISYIEAITLTPMRCSQFMDTKNRQTKFGKFLDKKFDSLSSIYEKLLMVSLEHKFKFIFVSIVVFISSLFLIKFIPKEFVPASDQGSLMLRVKTKEGSSLKFTDEKVREVENYLMKDKNIEKYFVSVGGFGGGESNSAMAFITLKAKKDRFQSQSEIANYLRTDFKKFKGAKVFVQDTSMSAFSSGRGFPIELTITGKNWEDLGLSAKKIMSEMEETKKFQDLDSNFKDLVPEVHIVPNREQAKRHGVSIEEIGTTISALVGGVVVGKYANAGHRYDMRLKLLSSERDDFSDLSKIKVRNNRGELIPLSEVATIENKMGPVSVSRQERSRAITIYGSMSKGVSQKDAMDLAKSIARKNLGDGSSILESGSSKTFSNSMNSLWFALLFGILIAYMVLGAQYNSFIDPFVILFALPFSFTGSFISLLVFKQSLNIYSMIGLILLMGLVKKNSILLVDFTKQELEKGKDIFSALKEACPKRLRPILMTTISTIVGALPAALSLGPGAESLRPMAVCVIGGMIFSTILTLVIVPPIYLLFYRKKKD